MAEPFVISPHGVCDSCNGHSGPKFSLHRLRGISLAHRNNEIPTGSELQSRLDGIRDTQVDICRLDVEIARLQETLKWLEQRRIELHDFNLHELSLFAPIRTLPDDIIRKIFMICQQENEVKPGYIHYSNPNTFVRTATQVSCYWRNTVLSMPHLWSRVSFKKVDKGHKRMSVSAGEFLEKCLTLSGSVPFSVEFGSPYGYASHKHFSDKCLMELANAAGRWEHFTTDEGFGGSVKVDAIMKYVPKDTVFHCLRTLAPVDCSKPITFHSTPVLSHLQLQWPSNSACISFPSAPLLTSIDTRASPIPPQNILPIFPWSQITHYQCSESFDVGQLPVLLDSMQNLISLQMDLDREIKLFTYVTLPRLEVLTFEFYSETISLEPLKFFTTPRLKALNVNGDCDRDMIMDLITRSGCSIEKLTVSGDTLLQGIWNVEQMKDVSYLHVWCSNESNFSKAIMELLTWDTSSNFNNTQIIFPRVENLHLEICGYFCHLNPFPAEELKALVTSRLRSKTCLRKGISHIKSMTVTIWRELEEIDKCFINEFRASDFIQHNNVDVTVIVKNFTL